ncbi:MAG: hypothetical protein K2J54_01545 [Clostridia bacterium]|nr:hypothetical protein [Clostridia bacterium]
MSAYVKKIAVIKQVKGGFSADGGAVSGIVKCETYAGFLKVEVSLINFAPLTEGRYVLGITDGLNTVTFEGLTYEGEGEFNLSSGFAFLVCFCHNTVAPIASAACGQMACALPDLKEEMVKRENIRPQKGGAAYDDEAIAEVNYYESSFKGGAAVRAAETQEKKRSSGGENEADTCAVESEKKSGLEQEAAAADEGVNERLKSGLAGGDFYGRMEGDIRRIFATYPAEPALERAMDVSKFVKITYGDNRFYVFGVLKVEGRPRYICYGVPATNGEVPPPSLKSCASFVATENGGYWMTYQDAATGISVVINNA